MASFAYYFLFVLLLSNSIRNIIENVRIMNIAPFRAVAQLFPSCIFVKRVRPRAAPL